MEHNVILVLARLGTASPGQTHRDEIICLGGAGGAGGWQEGVDAAKTEVRDPEEGRGAEVPMLAVVPRDVCVGAARQTAVSTVSRFVRFSLIRCQIQQ